MKVLKIAAFSQNGAGGNPAGVALIDAMPTDAEMLATAAEIGFSETAFVVPDSDEFRVRYFAPKAEVPFCGHATIATGAALGAAHGAGEFRLKLNAATITVSASERDGVWSAKLASPPTWTKPAPEGLLAKICSAFDVSDREIDGALGPRLIHAGATHFLLPLTSRERLATMAYPFDPVLNIMRDADLTTISLVWRESATLFHARNAFATGGVVEDPATGAAAAALGGFLRETGDPAAVGFTILQGEDMGVPSEIHVEAGGADGDPVLVSGETRLIG